MPLARCAAAGLCQVDSFFDSAYKIDFVGAPGSALDGLSGTTESFSKLEVTSDVIFADGFESGDTSSWSNTVPWGRSR